MGEQHYGRAPACDCLRCMGYRNIRGEWYSPKELMGVIRDVYSYGAVARTWFSDAIVGASAAWAIEQGLRAIAGWPMPLVEVCGGVMRTRCYFCAKPVSDGVCTVCGERQPE